MSIMGNNLMAAYWAQNLKPQMPTDGLIFWASLNGETPNVAETGQALTVAQGTAEYGSFCNVPCLLANSGSPVRYITFSPIGLPAKAEPCTISYWGSTKTMFNYGVNAGRGMRALFVGAASEKKIYLNLSSDNVSTDIVLSDARMYHFMATINGRAYAIYCDGILQKQGNFVGLPATVLSAGAIGKYVSGNNYFTGPIAACRIYNRVLEDSEITLLAHEFTPTT